MSKYHPVFQAGEVYHVWTHANGNENLFRTEDNFEFFLEKYIQHVHPVAETFAYCLMPNHLHLMIRVRTEKELSFFHQLKLPGIPEFDPGCFISQQFSNLFNAYTKAFNSKFERKGSLFCPNFKRKHIDSESYFSALITYIHNNPVHHGFVEDPEDWEYSSLNTYFDGKVNMVNASECIGWFGDLQAFKDFHRQFRPVNMEGVFEE